MLQNLAPGRRVLVGRDRTPMQVEAFRGGRRPRLKLRGVDTRDAAAALRGAHVRVPLNQAAPLAEGRYYAAELVGVRVAAVDGEALGTVREVLVTGSNDVYVVRGAGGELLIPAIADVVQAFDAERRVMTVDLLPGMR